MESVGDPTPLGKHFRDYELQVMDPYAYRDELATGAIDVTLRGRAFHVVVEHVPWDPSLSVATQAEDGSWTYQPEPFGAVAYTGTATDSPGSYALFVVTASGVYGYVRTAERNLHFEPARFFLPDAPVGVSVVFDAADIIWREDDAHAHSSAFVEAQAGMPPEDEMGALHHAGGPNRALALFADVEARNAAPNDYQSRIIDIVTTINVNYQRLVGFQFTVVGNTVHSCDATNCPADALLSTWANWVSNGGPWNGYELAHLFTGKPLSGHSGAAYQPGRYGYTTFGIGTDAESAIVAAHELGHNFNARHARGFSYEHSHGGGVVHGHQTIMDYGTGERVWEYSSANNNWIRACNSHSFTSGTFTPGQVGGFGDRCWTGEVSHQNGRWDWPSYDATDYRGKYFPSMTRGTVASVCVWSSNAGYAVLEARATPASPTPLFSIWIDTSGAGRWCASGDYTWTHGSMFIYKASGTAAIGWDTTSPDGWRSDDFGATWTSDGIRRGIEVVIAHDNLPADTCGVLASNAQLNGDGSIRSCNQKHQLIYQLDGNVVLYNSTGATKVDWATNTPSTSTGRFAMQGDGNLVLYDGAGSAIWASNTAGNAGAWLSLRDDGVLVILAKDGRTLWMEGCGLLGINSRILRGYEIRSCSREYSLAHQTDGNVVLYRNGVFDGWATNTNGWSGTTEFKMQDDGNLVLYAPPYAPWASDTPGNPNGVLRLTDQGRLFIETPHGEVLCNKLRC